MIDTGSNTNVGRTTEALRKATSVIMNRDEGVPVQ